MRNDGTTSEGNFSDAVEKKYGIRAFLYRIADQKEISRGNKLKVSVRQTPSDYILTLDGIMAYCEVKSCSNATSFPFSQFTPGQNAAMVRQDKAKGHYLIFIHHIPTNNWYRLPGSVVLLIRTTGSRRKSMTWDELKPYKIELKDI